MTNFLVSSAGRRGELVKILKQHRHPGGGKNKVLATDMSTLSAAGHLADAFALVPACTSESFISRTLELCLQQQIDVVIPTIDTELSRFADHKDDFASSGIDVWVSSIETCDLGFDKFKFHEWLVSNEFPSIPTQEINSTQHTIDGPVVFKPRSGSSSKGIVFADTADELASLHLSADYIMQKRITGIEVTADFAVTKAGEVSGVVLRRRLETRAGEVSKGVTIRHREIEELVRSVANALPSPYGVLNMQVIYDPETSDLHVLELNPRFGGGYPLAHLAGADLVSAMFDSVAARKADKWRPGVVFLRYDSEVSFEEEIFVSNPWA